MPLFLVFMRIKNSWMFSTTPSASRRATLTDLISTDTPVFCRSATNTRTETLSEPMQRLLSYSTKLVKFFIKKEVFSPQSSIAPIDTSTADITNRYNFLPLKMYLTNPEDGQ